MGFELSYLIIAVLNLLILFKLAEELNATKSKVSKNIKYLVLGVMGVLSVIIKSVIFGSQSVIFESISMNLMLILGIKFVFKMDWIRTIITEIAFLILNILVELSISLVIMALHTGSTVEFSKLTILIGSVISLLCIVVIQYIGRGVLINIYNKVIDIISKKYMSLMHYILLVGIPIILLIDVGLNYLDLIKQGHITKFRLIHICLIIVGYTIYTIIATRILVKSRVKVHELEQQNIYTESHKHIVKDVKEFWHGYSNIIQAVHACIQTENSDSMNYVVLKELLEKYSDIDLDTKLDLISIEHPVLAGIVSTKLSYAKSIGVIVNIQNMGATNINIKMVDLIDIMGILLDNAIEAAYYTDTKCIDLDITTKNNYLEISIFNFIKIEDGNILKYGESNNIGLSQVNRIVNKYDNIKYTVDKNDTYYKATLQIKEVEGYGNSHR